MPRRPCRRRQRRWLRPRPPGRSSAEPTSRRQRRQHCGRSRRRWRSRQGLGRAGVACLGQQRRRPRARCSRPRHPPRRCCSHAQAQRLVHRPGQQQGRRWARQRAAQLPRSCPLHLVVPHPQRRLWAGAWAAAQQQRLQRWPLPPLQRRPPLHRLPLRRRRASRWGRVAVACAGRLLLLLRAAFPAWPGHSCGPWCPGYGPALMPTLPGPASQAVAEAAAAQARVQEAQARQLAHVAQQQVLAQQQQLEQQVLHRQQQQMR